MFKSAGVATFDKLLEKATSNLLLEADLVSILGICDLIRQKDCPATHVLPAIKKKLGHQNPHVAFFGLQVLDVVVKNCGSLIHDEVATKEFMEYMRELAKTSAHENVREKVLELLQTWAHAFRKMSKYRAVVDVVNIMKAEGSKFPPLVDTDAMFTADTAPEWQDGGCCNRCRVEFGLMNRKHHCRACGQIFCAKCSSKTATLPKYGIEKEVRVCESCFEKYGKDNENIEDPVDMLMRASRGQPHHSNKSPVPQHHASQQQQPKGKTEEELAEEEQLQLALAISQSEAEAKERERESRMRNSGSNNSGSFSSSSNSAADSEKMSFSEKVSPQKGTTGTGKSNGANSVAEDPELARYLDRTYWEQRQGSQGREENSREETGGATGTPSAFPPSAPIIQNRNRVEQAEEIDHFMDSLRGQIEMFNNRMKSNSSRGRHISNDTSVQGLFMNITALHSQLLTYIQAQDDCRGQYEGLQDKLSQVRDARDALNALRNEHNERLRQVAEEAERQRQMQMAIKLNAMREKKHAYLQYQQEIALRRVQEEERQMQLRIEQQRMIPNVSAYAGYPPQGYMGGPPQPGMGMPPQQDPQQMHYMTSGGQYVPQQNTSMAQQYQPQTSQFMGHPGQIQSPPPGQGQMHHQGQMQGPPGQGPMPGPPGQTVMQVSQGQGQMQAPQGQGPMQVSQGQGQMQAPQGQGQGTMQVSQGQGQMQGPQGQGPMQVSQGPGQMQAPQGQGPMQVSQGQAQIQSPPQQHHGQIPPQQQLQGQMQGPPPQSQTQLQGPPPPQSQMQMPPQQQFYQQPPPPVMTMAQPASTHEMPQPQPQPELQAQAEPSTAELISFE